jgi:beta-1,4-mannosyltransferase
MQYHAYALAVNGVQVDFVGLAGAGLPSALREHADLTLRAVPDIPPAEVDLLYPVRAGVRALRQARRFAGALRAIDAADLVLVQTPPSVPSAVLGLQLARRHKARFVLDWHNLGWTLFAMKAGAGPAALLRTIEHWVGRRADAHLCVSKHMADHLASALGVSARVLYDRAPEWFQPGGGDLSRAVRARLFAQSRIPDTGGAALIVSPTSFTADEDLHMLLDAADVIEGQRAVLPRGFPRLLVIASGAGPGRGDFEARAAARPRDAVVVVRTTWVEADEYPALLAGADAGVCTHHSSSGFDLPMKIADMFGAGLPVIALGYPALSERVRDGENGSLFTNAAGLATIWRKLFAPGGADALAALKRASAAAGRERWLDGWQSEAAPVLL